MRAICPNLGRALLACMLALLAGCAGARTRGGTHTLTVFAAASLSEVFGEAGRAFEAGQPGVLVTFNFAGSQQLRAQLEHGAAADVFASADQAEMNTAIKSGLVTAGAERAFAGNSLALVVPKANHAHITLLSDLARPGLKLVVADPAVPVGRYTLALLDAASRDPAFGPDFKARVLANVVSREENVKAVLSKVQLDEADAGIVYGTDAANAQQDQVSRIDIPAPLNQAVVYPIAPLAAAREKAAAAAFVDYLLSPGGQQLLRQYGFTTVATTP
jgi:molybdate transport system substrate-binding protein